MTEEELPKPGETKNEFTGDVSDSATVYQLRDVRGDLIHVDNINVVNPPPVPVEPEPSRHPARPLLPFVPHLIGAILFGSLASILVVHHESLLFRVLAVLAALAPFALVAVLFWRTGLIESCTPKLLRDARPAALIALAVLTLLLAVGALIAQPRFWDGYPQRDSIVLAALFADVAALSAVQVLRKR